jgi:uncharacterized protein YjaG (DUF416 family)
MAEQKIIIEIEGKGQTVVKDLAEAYSYFKTVTKEADYELRKGNITNDQLQKRLKSVEEQANKVGLEYKRLVDITAAVYQVQQRAEVGFKSLGKSLNDINQTLQSKTNPLMISFTQIIQDAPFGIRGMGNNIQFLTQQFTQLRASGMATSAILRGMMMNIFTPMGFLLTGISLGTTALTIAFDRMGSSTEDLEKKQKKANEEIERERELRLDILNLQKEAGEISSEKYVTAIKAEIEILKKKRDELVTIWFLENRAFVAPTITLKAPGFTPSAAVSTGVNRSLSDEEQLKMRDRKILSMELTKQILDLQKLLDKLEDRGESKALVGLKHAVDEVSIRLPEKIERVSSIDDLIKLKREKPLTWVGLPNGEVKQAKDISVTEFLPFHKLKAVKVKQHKTDDIDMVKETQQELREVQRVYNSMLFDPVAAGFRALAGEIRQGLFGSLDDLQAKFGTVGAAIIESLSQVIAKLIEVAIMSAVLSAFFPGAGGFGNIFQSMLGLDFTPSIPGLKSVGGLGAKNTSTGISPMPTSFAPSMMRPIIAPIYVGDDQIGTLVINAMGRASYRRII